MFLYKLMSLPSSAVSRNIFFRKLHMYLSDDMPISKGFIPDICDLLEIYGLEHILSAYNDLPSKYSWKREVNTAVADREDMLWRQILARAGSFSRFRNIHQSITPAVVWRFPKDPTDLRLADCIAQLWTCVPDSELTICRLCDGLIEDTLRHIVCECSSTLPLRDAFLDDIYRTCSSEAYMELERSTPEILLQKAMGAPLIATIDSSMQTTFF